MQFSVGDKVVHPKHGAGRIAAVERQGQAGEAKDYYVIDIVGQGLVVHVPVLRAEELGIRPAMPPDMMDRVLSTLSAEPHRLPDDPKLRQEEIGATVRTGEVLPLARSVRDLMWYGERARLTKRDSDLLQVAQARLAAEMALVSGGTAETSTRQIAATVAAALAGALS